MKLIVPGQQEANHTLITLDEQRLDALSKRQMLVRPDHMGLAEFPIDPSRPDLTIEGSVLAFNPEVQHDEAVGLKLVRVGQDGQREGVSLNTQKTGLEACLAEGQQFGVYLFTPTPNTAGASKRIDELCIDGGRMVHVRGVRKRSLVCAVRIGDQPIAVDLNGEIPIPLMLQPKGFPRTYLQTKKRQVPGIYMAGPRGYQQEIKHESNPLVFGKEIPDDTPLTVAVLEFIEHEELETGPADLRPAMVALLGSEVDLAPKSIEPSTLASLQVPQKRLLTAMRVHLRKALPPPPNEAPTE